MIGIFQGLTISSKEASYSKNIIYPGRFELIRWMCGRHRLFLKSNLQSLSERLMV
jgi:hypothetical protein